MSTKTQNLLERLPPQDLDAEASVLGSILMDGDKIDDVALMLRPEDFYRPANAKIYATMLELRSGGRGVDAGLLTSTLKRRGEIEDVGGFGYLAEVTESVPTPSHAVWYAEHVRDCSLLRSMIHAGAELIHEAYHGDGDPRERIAKAESRMMEILERGVNRNVRHVGDLLHEALAEIDARATRGTVAGLSTGFVQLDLMMGGLRPGELIIIAARPSHGKSALAGNITEYVSIASGRTTLLVCLEMSSQEMCERMLCSVSGIDGYTLRNGLLKSEQQPMVVEAAARISQAPMFIDDSSQRNIAEIASAARRLKRTEDLSLLIVDYLQLIEPENKRDPREQQVAIMSRRLKHLARELKIPVVCLAQLNREAEKEGEKPKLRHLRESGAIEQDADVVLFVHRADMYRQPDKWDHKADIGIAKNRNGKRGWVELHWDAPRTKFENPPMSFDPDQWDYPGGSDF